MGNGIAAKALALAGKLFGQSATTSAERAALQQALTAAGVTVPDAVARATLAVTPVASLAAIEALQTTRTRGAALRSAPVVGDTVPTVVAGTRYYIDPLHPAASDSNNGTSPSTPWATLSKMMGQGGAGAVFHIAADAVFDMADTITAYRAKTRFPFNGADALRGTQTQPCVIKRYFPRQTSVSARVNQAPLLRWYGAAQASDWAQEASIGPNVWSMPWSTSSNSDVSIWLSFGATIDTATLGMAPRQQVAGQSYGNTPQQLAKDRDYAISATKIYVYAPANPSAYYGGVFVGGLPIFASSFQGGHYLKVFGLRFEMCSAFSLEYASSNQNALQGFELAYCRFHRADIGYFNNKATASAASEMEVSFHDNYLTEVPTMAIRLGTGNGGTAGNTMSWEVYRNRLFGGNFCSSLGGALLYVQCQGGTKHIAWGNYGYDCRNGTGGNNIDGAFIYTDVSSQKAIVTTNIAERCALPFQHNNAIGIINVANLAIDCGAYSWCTGATDVASLPGQTYVVGHNTWLWTGRIALTDLQRGPGVPVAGPVFNQFNDQFGAYGTKHASYALLNNMAVSFSGDTASKPFATYNKQTITTFATAGNAAVGLATIAAINDPRGAATDETALPGAFALLGAVTDASILLPEGALGNAQPARDSALLGLGAMLSQQYMDMSGRPYATRPTPGCLEMVS